MAGTSAQGLTFSFGTTELTVTSFAVNNTNELIDGSHLGIPPNGSREFVGGFATETEVTCDFLSTNSVLIVGTSNTLSISGPVSFSGNATLQSKSITGSVGALISGSATFRVA